jgi:hypothetical protein
MAILAELCCDCLAPIAAEGGWLAQLYCVMAILAK